MLCHCQNSASLSSCCLGRDGLDQTLRLTQILSIPDPGSLPIFHPPSWLWSAAFPGYLTSQHTSAPLLSLFLLKTFHLGFQSF